jgi:hypothetical protein
MATADNRVRRAAHSAVHGAVRRAAKRLGYEVLWPTYYNGLPRFDELPEGFWDRRSSLPGIAIDEARSLGLIEDLVTDSDFRPARRPAPGAFYLPNGSYGLLDALILWGLLRKHRPARVLELGAGFSTLLIRDALAANGEGEHIVVDPFPRYGDLGDTSAFDLRLTSAADVSPEQYAELGEGDVVFIDTTHTVKVGSEVNAIILEGLPHLRPGVLVHFHDIFLPFEYPRRLTQALGYHWAEQYLLQAFLAFNENFEVLIPTHLLSRGNEPELRRLVGGDIAQPSSFWLRRR